MESEHIKGLFFFKNVIEPNLLAKLLASINSREWSNELSRRVQHYGLKYDYTLREPLVKKLDSTTPIPKELALLGQCLHDMGLLPHMPNQVIVNEYEEGQGIGKHRDHHPIFKDGIATITLAGRCTMDFEVYSTFANYDRRFEIQI